MKIDDNNLGKFDLRTNEVILLSYSSKGKPYKWYNKIQWKIVECIDVRVDDTRIEEKHINENVEEVEYEDIEEENDRKHKKRLNS